MDTRDKITLLSAFIVAAGWFVNSALNRRHEVAKRRMEHRLEALRSFLPVLFAVQEDRSGDPQFAKDLAAARTRFQLYCYCDEAEEFERLVGAIERRDDKAYNDSLRTVARLVRERIRKELGLDAYCPKETGLSAR